MWRTSVKEHLQCFSVIMGSYFRVLQLLGLLVSIKGKSGDGSIQNLQTKVKPKIFS